MEHAFAEMPLAVFTTLAAIGAGAFIALAVAFLTTKFSDEQLAKIDKFTLVPAIVVIVGFIAAFFHLANPMAAFGVFGGIGRSPMSNELAVAMLFAVVMIVYVILGLTGKLGGALRTILACLLAVLAIVFAVFIGLAYSIETVPTWSTPWPTVQMLGYTLLGGAAMGTCVLAVAGALDDAVKGPFKVVLIGCAAIGLVLAVVGLGMMFSGAGEYSNSLVTGAEQAAGAMGIMVCSVVCLVLACCAVLAAALGKAPVPMALLAVVLSFAGVLAGRFVFYALQISVGIFL